MTTIGNAGFDPEKRIHAKMSEDDIRALVKELDAGDGKSDGKITPSIFAEAVGVNSLPNALSITTVAAEEMINNRVKDLKTKEYQNAKKPEMGVTEKPKLPNNLIEIVKRVQNAGRMADFVEFLNNNAGGIKKVDSTSEKDSVKNKNEAPKPLEFMERTYEQDEINQLKQAYDEDRFNKILEETGE